MKKWKKHEDPTNKYGGMFTLGDRNIELPLEAVISITRGEQLSIPRLVINSIINQFIMNALTKNEDLLYAELTGQIQGGTSEEITNYAKQHGRHFTEGKLVRRSSNAHNNKKKK